MGTQAHDVLQVDLVVLEAAQAAVTVASAQVRTAESHMAKSDILSPMDGVVAMRGVSVGDRVENMGSGAPMFRIVDNRLMDLTMSVPSSDLARVRVGQAIEVSPDTDPSRVGAWKTEAEAEYIAVAAHKCYCLFDTVRGKIRPVKWASAGQARDPLEVKIESRRLPVVQQHAPHCMAVPDPKIPRPGVKLAAHLP